MTGFSTVPLYPAFIETLTAYGITQPTPIQAAVIPQILDGQSVFFESETGTGKTLAFLLPLLTRLMENRGQCTGSPSLLILSPTVELASQIKEAAGELTGSSNCGIKALLCVGGTSLKRQIEGLKEKPALIIGTPARVADLVSLKKLKLRLIETVVIDEADRQLSQESRDMLQTVLNVLPAEVQIIACSATLNEKNTKLLYGFLPAGRKPCCPQRVSLTHTRVLQDVIEHWAFLSDRRDKTAVLRSLIYALKEGKMLIFTSPAHEVENLAQKLQYKNIDAVPLYGKLDGADRKRIITRFRSGKIRILITSDLSARGLDISDIDYVVQVNLSKDADVFIHRAGRTGRAGRKGVNIVIGDEYELLILQGIEKKLGITVHPKILFEGRVQKPE